ncbi:hypothetical protein PQX77_014411 [Marasmius sp. AFHP31]|nr:hypothetical protein PQX77_014411 [Marasmius sp. AFHP31]
MRRKILFTLPFIIPLGVLPFFPKFSSVVAFRIEPPLPPTVTPHHGVAFTWIRDDKDPRKFGFQKIPHGHDPSEIFSVIQGDKDGLSGEFTLTFTHEVPYQIVAVNTDPTSTFFTAPNLVVAAHTEAHQGTESTGTSPGSDSGATSTSTPSDANDPHLASTVSPGGINDPSSTPANTTPKSKGPIPIIVGSTIGGVVFLLLLILSMIFLRRRHRRQLDIEDENLFHRDKMVLQKPLGIGDLAIADAYEYTTKGKGRVNNGTDSDTGSPTTTLKEGSHENEAPRGSISMSIYSRENAVGTRIRSSLAGIGTSPAPANVSIFGHDRLVESPAPLLYSSERPLSPLRSPSRARTDRQMQIEKKIFELQGRLITVAGAGKEKTRAREELRGKIDEVKQLKDSDWALQEGPGSGGEVPAILRD